MTIRKMIYAALLLAALSAGAVGEADLRGNEVQSLRAEGPTGLKTFLETHSEALARGDSDAKESLDRICAQYDCKTSKLYWYTDLEAAKARARAEHKPILSV